MAAMICKSSATRGSTFFPCLNLRASLRNKLRLAARRGDGADRRSMQSGRSTTRSTDRRRRALENSCGLTVNHGPITHRIYATQKSNRINGLVLVHNFYRLCENSFALTVDATFKRQETAEGPIATISPMRTKQCCDATRLRRVFTQSV